MKILHALPTWLADGYGGIQRYVFELASAQTAADQAIVLAGSAEIAERPIRRTQIIGERLRVHRVQRDDRYHYHWAKAWHPGVQGLVDEVLAEERPDVVHLHHWTYLTANLVARAAAAGVPSVATLHDYWASCPRFHRRRVTGERCERELSIESCLDCVPRYGHESDAELGDGIALFAASSRSELAMARALIVALPATAERLSRVLGLPQNRFRVHGLAVGRRWRDPEPAAFPAGDEPFRYATWGVGAEHKGLHVALGAFERLRRRNPERAVELHVIGPIEPREYAARLRELAGAGVYFESRFEQFAGPNRPHAALFPTLCFETYGLVLDEARELGLPCLVTAGSALAERLREPALCVSWDDEHALSAAMGALLDRESWQRARETVANLAVTSLHEHVIVLRGVYDEAIAAGPPDLAAAVPTARWIEYLVRQRESAQVRAKPDRGPR